MDPFRSLLYGAGVFTTVRSVAGEPWLWPKHWRRLCDHATALKMDLSGHTEEKLAARVQRALKAEDITDGRARITFYDDRPSALWQEDSIAPEKTGVSILVAEPRPRPTAFSLSISPFTINSRSPIAGLKTCNYLEPLLAFEEAGSRGFDEAIRLNERGHITSACMANVFWSLDGKLRTPALSTGCLAGTTREFILENVDCEEVEGHVEELYHADAVYLCSAGLGVVPVERMEDRETRMIDDAILHLVPGNGKHEIKRS